jgi:hypothetical protein
MARTVITLSDHLRRKSIERVDALQRSEVRRLTNEAEAKARCDENDSQRQIHIAALEHVIRAAWVSPALGSRLTKKAIAAIEERLTAEGRGKPLLSTLRDSLEIETNTVGKE